MSKNDDTGCGIWGLLPAALIIIYILYQYFIVSPELNATETKRLNDFWTSETVQYFEGYKCENLGSFGRHVSVQKFIVIESSHDNKCTLKEANVQEFEKDSYLKNYYTRKISEANVIVWIDIMEGKEDGRYENGSRAIKNKVELKFIDKNSNSIYKTIILDSKGSAPDQILRKSGSRKPEYFGIVSIDEIKEAIKNELL